MAQTAGLLFTNDSGAGSGTSSYVIDTLPDYTFSPSNNTGFSSTVSNNPLNNSYANTDLPQYGAKTLFIKDLVFVNDRSKWIQGKTTYQIIFTENFPQIQAYAFGNVQLNNTNGQGSVLVKTIGDGVSINGVIRQVAFILQPNTAATATAQVVVDNANEGTVDFSSYTSAAPTAPSTNVFAAYLHNSTQESYNIHDIRLTALQASTLNVAGIIPYFQNTGSNLDQFPGTSYVNKTKVTTSVGATLNVPSFGSSLGGNFCMYKTQFAGYTMSAISATTIASTASGSSGTNLVNMAVGTGASLVAGYGMVISQGSSTYVGSITSISTDTLTMGNTLGFDVSATSTIYTAWKAGSTLAINASLMTMAYSVDISRMSQVSGFSATIFDPKGLYALWGNNIGFTTVDGNQCGVFLGASGFMQMDGYFSAAEIETIGNGIFAATLSVNGFASWSQSAGQTGVVKKTVFTDAGPGWNSFNIGCGTSMGLLGIQRINLYQRSRDIGVSYGAIADFDIPQTYTNRDAINASLMALGGVRRVYADQLYFKNTWLRGQTWTVPGGVYYQGASTNGSLSFQYYGTNFGIIGTLSAGSTLTLDGIGYTLTANTMQSVATLGFHTVVYTGGTAVISAIDYLQPIVKSKVDLTLSPVLNPAPAYTPPVVITYTGGSGTYTPSVNGGKRPLYLRGRISGGGAGGEYGGTANASPVNGGNTTFGPLTAGGGFISASTISAGGAGGTNTINPGPVIIVNNAGAGGGGASANAINSTGGQGGSNYFGGAGGGGGGTSTNNAYNGGNGAGYGAGGGGGGTTGASSGTGGGGGAGGYLEFIIPNPAGSYSFGVGASGAGGTSSANGGSGGNGASGVIIIEEIYQ